MTTPAHDLYRQFIRPGDLVFDIGANVGLRTSVFLDLGANVVAVEPQAESAALIDPRAEIVVAGVAEKWGYAELLICDEPACSTFSPDFILDLTGSGLLEYTWAEKRRVLMMSLDELIALYGVPAFCKIDVEGYEINVLAGLTHALPALSFEAHAAQPWKWRLCQVRLAQLGVYQYTYSPRESFVLEDWDAPFDVGEWGDIYARRLP